MRSAWAVFPKWMLLSLAHLDHQGRGFKATSKGSTQIGIDLVLAKTTIRRNRMATISITSNDGTLDSASAVLEVTATNPEYNQPGIAYQTGKQLWRRGLDQDR